MSTAPSSSTRSSGGGSTPTIDSGKDFRVIQFTPPGSGCSVIFGKNVTPAAPGSAQGLYLIVSDIQAARKELLDRGVQISEVFHNDGVYGGSDEPYLFGRVRVGGPDPEHRSYRSFASFRDPDGNGWLFQEITARLAGRIDPAATTFASANDLANAMRRASAAHGEHEKRIGAAIRTGPTGTPRTWWRSRPGRGCRSERLRREPRAGTRRTDCRRDRRQLGDRARDGQASTLRGRQCRSHRPRPPTPEHAARELGAVSSAAFDATDFERLERFFDELPIWMAHHQ